MTVGVEVATLVISVASLVGAGFALWRTHCVERRSLLIDNHRQFINPDGTVALRRHTAIRLSVESDI